MNSTATTHAATLCGARILVVEDIYWLADDLRRAFTDRGAEVLGPTAHTDQAIALLESGGIDAAVLDINLDGDLSFPIAEWLSDRDVPFLFATGYDEWAIPAKWRSARRVGKPFCAGDIVANIEILLQRGRAPELVQ